MGTVLKLAAVFIFLASCVSTRQLALPVVPEPPTQALNGQSRQVAANSGKKAFEYFDDGNFFVKFKKMTSVAKQLLASMPDKANAKKRLVRQFVSDLTKIQTELAKDKVAIMANSNSWLPPQTSSFSNNLRLLAQAVQSSNIMDRMGIYLTSSGVMESDTMGEEFYYTMLAQAIYQIDSEIRKTGLAYLPENRDADENSARLAYAKALAADVRTNIRHKFQANVDLNIKTIDKLLAQICAAETLQKASQVKKLAAYKYTQDSMKGLHIINSSDIQGFEDEVELTLSTKFSFEMINELISSVR